MNNRIKSIQIKSINRRSSIPTQEIKTGFILFKFGENNNFERVWARILGNIVLIFVSSEDASAQYHFQFGKETKLEEFAAVGVNRGKRRMSFKVFFFVFLSFYSKYDVEISKFLFIIVFNFIHKFR